MTTGAVAALAERALKWSAATTVARFVLQFAAQVALARMLGPDNFGVYGIGIAVLTFVGFLSAANFSYSLMLQATISEEDIRFSFTWQMVVGIACAAAMAAAAPMLAGFFGDPRVTGMVQLLAVASLLMAATAPATYLLQRDLNFRAVGLIQLVSYAAGYLAVGVPMAMAGFGAWALGTACVVQAAVALVATYRARPHPLRPLWRHPGGAEALATGRTVFVTNVVNWLLNNMDRVIIGRVLNAHAVGLYTVAYNLASIPNVLLLGVVQPTFLAAGARLQADREKLAQGWRVGVAFMLVLGIPAGVVGALLAIDLVNLLYGPAWTEAGFVLGVLFVCLPAWACWGLSNAVLWNTGRKHYESLLQMPLLAVALPAWWFFAPAGIRAIALISVAVVFARSLVIVTAARRALDVRWAAIAPHAARGAALAALCGGATLLGQGAGAALGSLVVALLAGGAGATLAFAGVLRFKPDALGNEALETLARIAPRVLSRRPAAPTVSDAGPIA